VLRKPHRLVLLFPDEPSDDGHDDRDCSQHHWCKLPLSIGAFFEGLGAFFERGELHLRIDLFLLELVQLADDPFEFFAIALKLHL
jgi:hypothetical protein